MIQGNDIGIVDIAVAKLFYFDDVSARFELICDECQVFQRYAYCFVMQIL